MPDLIIKPTNTSGNKVIIQDQAGVAVLTTADSGATLSGGVTFASGKLFHGMTSITATGATTWTKPAGVTAIMVYITGGGGGGGSGNNNYNSYGGGGAGGTAIKWITSGIGSTETITIGTGGAGGAASDGNVGVRGVTSSFGSHCSATGGYGGAAGAEMIAYADSDRGNGVGGDINLFGGDGQNYQGGNLSADYAGGSIGGGSYWGTGGMAGGADGGSPGRPGRAYGSGGGSGDHHPSTSPVAHGAGGLGKSGICIIYTYSG
jgi:hypothetical protein